MSKHSKPSDDPTNSKSGKSIPASGASAQRAALAASKGARSVSAKKEQPWTDVASFVINFERRAVVAGRSERRITAHKMQDGGITAGWTGLAQQPLVEWIADHVGDWGDSEPVQSLLAPAVADNRIDAKPTLCDTTAVALSITAVEAHQAGGIETTAGARAREQARGVVLRSGTAFDLDAVVEISGLEDEILSTSAPCTVQFFSRNTVTQERSRLGEVLAGAQAAGRSSYSATLPQITLPAGTYRVASVAILKGTPPKLAYAQGPLLEIV